MTGPYRWLPGVLLTVLASVAVVAAMTQTSRSNLRKLQEEAASLAQRETALIERIAALNAAQAGTPALPSEAIWTKGGAASVEVALQQALVSAAGQAGLQLASFSETTLTNDLSLPIVADDLELTGTHESLASFLSLLEASQPPIAVSYLWLRQLPPDQGKPGALVSVRLTAWGFRQPEGAQ